MLLDHATRGVKATNLDSFSSRCFQRRPLPLLGSFCLHHHRDRLLPDRSHVQISVLSPICAARVAKDAAREADALGGFPPSGRLPRSAGAAARRFGWLCDDRPIVLQDADALSVFGLGESFVLAVGRFGRGAGLEDLLIQLAELAAVE